jgi:hypothetical protein
MRDRLTQALVPLAAAGLLLLGLVALGKLARHRLRDEARYSLPFEAVECPAPPGSERVPFLGEVQYLARLPDRLRLLDEDLPRRLADAFARHPWVERVEAVEVTPPEGVRVRLRFRTPALAVPQPGGVRVVDRRGVLLPASAPDAGLPVYPGVAPPPRGAAGEPWGDPAVEAAARGTE